MTHFIFKPSKRKEVGRPGRSRYVGSWVEPESKKIDLTFSLENLRVLIESARQGDGRFSDFDIVRWCGSFGALGPESEDERFRAVARLAHDIDAQWDLNLFNSYSTEGLQALDVDSVRLPDEWWTAWLERLERLAGSNDAV